MSVRCAGAQGSFMRAALALALAIFALHAQAQQLVQAPPKTPVQQPGQGAPPAPRSPEPVACPTPAETSYQHLYGLWRAEFSGGAPAATLLLEKHPEYGEGVRGAISRDGVKGWVAGDVDDGELNLDESDDGIKIAANWAGTVVENSCGKEIRGTWTPETGKPQQGFVLRKVPGWQ